MSLLLTVGAACGLTYVVTGSDLLALPRLWLAFRFPRSLGALVSCAPCTGFWMALLVGIAVQLGAADCGAGRVVLGALSVTGLLWLLAAFSGGLLGIAKSLESVAAAQAWRPSAPPAPPAPFAGDLGPVESSAEPTVSRSIPRNGGSK